MGARVEDRGYIDGLRHAEDLDEVGNRDRARARRGGGRGAGGDERGEEYLHIEVGLGLRSLVNEDESDAEILRTKKWKMVE